MAGNLDPARRQRNLSPQDISILAQRAGRRNASQGSFESNVNSSEAHESHLPQNVFGIQRTPSPLVVTQYHTQRSPASAEIPSAFALAHPHSREVRTARARDLNRGLGYGLGLDSNMPSQLPRNLQEAAAAARHHASRVRAMQRDLASDPNVMVPQTPRSSSQLTAAGPPLTGHDTTSANTLPSVLNPFYRQPMMNYKQGLQAIINETGTLLFRLTQLEPMPVSVVFYDDGNRSIGISEGLVLTKETDLKALVTFTQELLDEQCEDSAGHDGGRLIIKIIEIRNGTKETKQGYPALKGECIRGQRGESASWVRWITGGDMEMYWKAYRIELQTQVPQPGSKLPVVKPIFKVRTVRQVLDLNEYYRGGHEFIEDPTVEPTPSTAWNDNRARADGGVALEAAREASGDRFPSLSHVFGQLQFGGDAAASSTGSANSGSSSNGCDAPESSAPKIKTKPIDPTRNWGYYQRMGGDPRMHRLYDLSHVPFEVEDFPKPNPGPFITPDIIVHMQDGWNDDETQGSLTPKASDGPVQTPYSAAEKAWREKAAREFEAAISFEDDDSFFPNYDTQIPDARKILTSRLMGQQKQLNPKVKGKETEANNFFNGYCAPNGSQDHLTVFGLNSLNYGGKGQAEETDTNDLFTGSNAVDGGHGQIGVSSSEAESYDGKGKAKQADDNSLYGSYVARESSQDHLVPSYGGTFKNSNMLQPPMATATTTLASNAKSPHAKVSSMNVHAPDFNYQQITDQSNVNTLSPYLQSLAGPQPSYTQPNAYGHMLSQGRSCTPITQAPSPTMVCNQVSSIQKNNSSATMFSSDYRPNFGNQTFYPQQGSSSILHPPNHPYAPNPSVSPVPKYGSPPKMFNAGAYSIPTHSGSQQGRSRDQRSRSPQKVVPRQNAVPAATLRHPSPGKLDTQQGFVSDFQYGQNAIPAQMPSYPSPKKTNARQGLGSGFQYGQSEQLNFNFDFHLPSQGSAQNGGQGLMMGGGQVCDFSGGEGST